MSTIIKNKHNHKNKKQNSKKNGINFYDYAKINNIKFDLIYDGDKKTQEPPRTKTTTPPKESSTTPTHTDTENDNTRISEQKDKNQNTKTNNETEIDSEHFESETDTPSKLEFHKTSSNSTKDSDNGNNNNTNNNNSNNSNEYNLSNIIFNNINIYNNSINNNNNVDSNKPNYIKLCNFINTENININQNFYINLDNSEKNRQNFEEQLKLIQKFFLKNQMFFNFCLFNQNVRGYKYIAMEIEKRLNHLESCKFFLPNIFNQYQYYYLIDFIYKKYQKLSNENKDKVKNEKINESNEKNEKKENNLPDHQFFYVNHKEEVQTNNVLYLIEGLFSEKNLGQDYILLKFLNRDGYASIKQLPNHPQLTFLKIKSEHLYSVYSTHRENEITETVETFDDILIRNKEWVRIKKNIPSIGQVFNNSMNIISQMINNLKNYYLALKENITNKTKNFNTIYQANQQDIQRKLELINKNNNKENSNQNQNKKNNNNKINIKISK